MGFTPDDFPGPLNEEGIIFDDEGVDPTAVGELRYSGGEFKAKDNIGVFDLRGAGGGITEAQHNALRVLVHLADGVGGPWENFTSGAFREITGTVFPSAIVWWESAAKLKKIVEKTITYTGAFPTTIAWKAYDTDGTTVLVTVTDSITYSGPFETNRTRTIS